MPHQTLLDELMDHIGNEEKYPQNRTLRELASTPLMLAQLCVLHAARRFADGEAHGLPARRTELYEALIQQLNKRREGHKALTTGLPVSAADILVLQERLAWDHATTRNPNITLARLRAAAAECEARLDTPGLLMEFLRERNGLLVALGDDETRYRHPSFHEYLLARGYHSQPEARAVTLAEALSHGEVWDNALDLLMEMAEAGLSSEGAPRASLAPVVQALSALPADELLRSLQHVDRLLWSPALEVTDPARRMLAVTLHRHLESGADATDNARWSNTVALAHGSLTSDEAGGVVASGGAGQ